MDLWIPNLSIISKKASVCSDQPKATSIGIDILKKGGNAADAAVATMAAVSVIMPYVCGIGGDCQCLFFRSKDKTVLSVNGSGRTGKDARLEKVKAAGIDDPAAVKYKHHGLWVSVPGTVAAMFEIVKHFGSGKLTMKEILAPVIKLAEEGTPVPYKVAITWERSQELLKTSKNAEDLLVEGKSPKPGDVMKFPKLAQCLQNISEEGPESFYYGNTAQNIVKAVQDANGVLTLDDLKNHLLDPPSVSPSEAVSSDFNGFRIWEMKPNSIGIMALVTLNVLREYDLKVLGHNTSEYIHLLSEAMKHSVLESWEYLCDPKCCPKLLQDLLSEETAKKIRCKIDPKRASRCNVNLPEGNTSYVAVVDEEGNGCSLICSVSTSFGSRIIPDECGFVLHNRAKSLFLDEKSPNVFGPKKLPLHTLTPSIVTNTSTNELLAVFGVIGAWMQPQGHVQVLLNMVIFGMDPQTALNQPRFFVGNTDAFIEYKDSLHKLNLEGGIDASVLPYLENKGYDCQFLPGYAIDTFGKGHVIARSKLFGRSGDSKTWWSGADLRSNGCTMGI